MRASEVVVPLPIWDCGAYPPIHRQINSHGEERPDEPEVKTNNKTENELKRVTSLKVFLKHSAPKFQSFIYSISAQKKQARGGNIQCVNATPRFELHSISDHKKFEPKPRL